MFIDLENGIATEICWEICWLFASVLDPQFYRTVQGVMYTFHSSKIIGFYRIFSIFENQELVRLLNRAVLCVTLAKATMGDLLLENGSH